MTTEEFEMIAGLAGEASMSVGGFMRACAIGGQITPLSFKYKTVASTLLGSTFTPVVLVESNLVGGLWIDQIENFANSNS
jgi:hypothetical protein